MSAIPHSVEAERAVLGGLMLDPERIGDVLEWVTADSFYREAHQQLFGLMVDMAEAGTPIEMVAVVEELSRRRLSDAVGGVSYVSSLPDNVPSTANLKHYARMVADRHTERSLQSALRDGLAKIAEGGTATAELLNLVQQSVFGVEMANEQGGWQGLGPVVEEQWGQIQERADNPRNIMGMTTGLSRLDDLLKGLHRTDLVILAARPAMGKTALALNIARAVAQQGHGVGFFSLEMSQGQLATRMLVGQARVNAGKVRTGYLSSQDMPRLHDAVSTLYDLPVQLDDTPGLNILQLRERARRLVQQHPDTRLIVVDYIGLLGGNARQSRQEQVAEASRGLKLIAKELNVCVLALSQLNRQVENRNPKIPQLSDLRESGAIEQDADVIMFIYRDDYYNPDSTTRPGVADIIVAKQRQGPTGTVHVAFQGELTLFSDLSASDNSGWDE